MHCQCHERPVPALGSAHRLRPAQAIAGSAQAGWWGRQPRLDSALTQHRTWSHHGACKGALPSPQLCGAGLFCSVPPAPGPCFPGRLAGQPCHTSEQRLQGKQRGEMAGAQGLCLPQSRAGDSMGPALSLPYRAHHRGFVPSVPRGEGLFGSQGAKPPAVPKNGPDPGRPFTPGWGRATRCRSPAFGTKLLPPAPSVRCHRAARAQACV